MSEEGDPSFSQKVWAQVFELFAFLDEKRRLNPTWAEIISISVIFLVELGLSKCIKVPQAIEHNLLYQLSIAAVCAFVGNRFIINGLLPILAGGRLAIAMRQMGMDRVLSDGEHYAAILSKYLKHHDPQEKIGVICISGRHLFHVPEGPLHDYALRGHLDVIMPLSEDQNPTVMARFGTYAIGPRVSMQIESINDLVNEMERSKLFLRERGNSLMEHSILCAWRVVLLSSHCIVQPYFPNRPGGESHRAPVFVYENLSVGRDTCYSTFSALFDMIKKYGSGH